MIENQFLQLEEVISGQRIEEIKNNYDLRSKLAKFKPNVSAIWVKFVTSNKHTVSVNEQDVAKLPSNLYEADYNIEGYVTTFRIGKDTTFSEIFSASCKFWDLNKFKYILTDEYFNNLELYDEPISVFFKYYEPLNPFNQAIVYVANINSKMLEDERDSDNYKKSMSFFDNDEGEAVDIKKIEKTLVGLEFEKAPSK